MTSRHSSPEYVRAARQVRMILTPRIAAGSPVACVDCGRLVQAGQLWDVAHRVALSAGGGNSLSNMGASHRTCNRQAGGRLGARRTNAASRRARRLPTW